MKINKAVTYYRELCGASEYKLATRSGIDRGALHRMLRNNEWNPEMFTLQRIARALSIQVSDIILHAEES
jgi:DNA-binding Xre family transcriptional regulator